MCASSGRRCAWTVCVTVAGRYQEDLKLGWWRFWVLRLVALRVLQALLLEVELCLLLQCSATIVAYLEVDSTGLALVVWHVGDIVHRWAFYMTRRWCDKSLFLT